MITREITNGLREEFRSNTCPQCKGLKCDATAFCKRCYFSLPLPMQTALWKPVGRGYEEAVLAAKAYLSARAVTA